MNLDNIQRLNQLARDLLKHGLASSLDEAVKKAQLMINTQALRDTQSIAIKNTSDTLAVSPQGADMGQSSVALEQTEQKTEQKDDNNQLNQVDEQMDQEAIKKLETKVSEQQNTINMLVSKMNEIIKELNVLGDAIKHGTPAPAREAPHHEEHAEAASHEESAEHEKEKPQGTARTGQYTSNDVAIDKFFYSGSKK